MIVIVHGFDATKDPLRTVGPATVVPDGIVTVYEYVTPTVRLNGPASPAKQPQYVPHSAVQEGLSVQSSEVDAADRVVEVCDGSPAADNSTVAPPAVAPVACSTSKTA